MATKAPQVLSRKANGVASVPGSQPNESAKRNGNDGHGPKAGRGKGSGAKQGDTAKQPNEGESPRPARTKPQNEGEKLVVRRLPPGMTQSEFSAIIGPDWDVGKGKVDWLSYAAGKVSTDLSKPSRPGRAYIHIMRKDDIMPLSEVVRTATWEDAKNSFTNPSLVGPPCLELGIYKKVPSNKKRSDARQGTIDQDPEFMTFLEELANPTPARDHVDLDDGDDLIKTETKVTTTPLIEYLKEKKANKHKDNASGKNSKHGTAGKGKGGSRDDESSKKKGKESRAEKSERTSKETVKILTKKEATEQASEAAKNAAAQINAANASENPKNRRAGIAAAARILQRDLGLSPGSAHRRARQDAAKVGTDSKPASSKDTGSPTIERPESPAPSTESTSQASKAKPATPAAPKAQTPGRRNRGGKNADKGKAAETATPQPSAAATNPPVILKKKGDAEGSQATTEAAGAQQSSTTGKHTPNPPTQKGSGKAATQKKLSVTPNATRSFVKHANTSQGVTEAALKEALETFGAITFVEIDKRKGFAYVDFAEHESLVQAVAASPITVAQGSVQVLERKDKKPAVAPTAGSSTSASGAPEKGSGSGSGRGRRGRGGGKGASAASGQAPAAPANSGGSG